MAFQFLLDRIQNLAWQTKLFTIWPWLPLFHLFQPFASSNLIYFSPTEPRHSLRSLSDPSNSTFLQPPKAIKTLILPGLLLQTHLQLRPTLLRSNTSVLGPSNMIFIWPLSQFHSVMRSPGFPVILSYNLCCLYDSFSPVARISSGTLYVLTYLLVFLFPQIVNIYGVGRVPFCSLMYP